MPFTVCCCTKPQGRDWDDIGYNFQLVGGDGIVYAGRGWDSVGGHFDNTVWNQTMNIALIGNFTETLPPWLQREQVQKFIAWGITMGKIQRDYQLLGACQIKNTLSPGGRLMDDLRTWARWWDHLDRPGFCQK
ncbi:Peptidoglycan recognition protein 1 [Frankliniella fusca]|uniref:Peptidoglycan recognition protein 1 n=1 Tax=Frankliniella fusca TaxID=407009 RepID=A0AAE1H0P1_9NEOP|nr:Peptidoglycan recognition protein 1 [Frankliniella fusca]